MAAKTSNCPHVTTVGDNTWDDIHRKRMTQDVCDSCDCNGPNLWLCLQARCLYVGCGESAVDHSSSHSEAEGHFLTLNLTTLRIWCYECECEVFRDRNNPPLIMYEKGGLPPDGLPLGERGGRGEEPPSPTHSCPQTPSTPSPSTSSSPFEEDTESESDDDTQKPRGLTGLQNIGNTCYMNAAIQSLSNCPPLSRFFLDCQGYVRTDKKPLLSRSYMKLMQDIWHKKRPSYVVPNSVSHGIKFVHPMFRGYTQQDSQEFLRCFMDQIHEELKQPVASYFSIENGKDDKDSACVENGDEESQDELDERDSTVIDTSLKNQVGSGSGDPSNSQSDTEYETCDSGLSSERSSVEHNLSSGDEGVENGGDRQSWSDLQKDSKDQEQGTQTANQPRRTKRDKNRVNPQENGNCEEGEESKNPKAVKENANMAHKHQQKGSQSGEQGTKDGEGDTGEFSDAVSEMEPLQSDKSRTESGLSVHLPRGQKVSRMRPTSESDLSRHSGDGAKNTVSFRKKRTPLQYRSVISDVFDGRILSSVQCLTCERVSSTKETFQDLSLPIPSKDHLHMIHATHQQNSSSGNSSSHKGTCGEVSLNQGGLLSWMFGWMKNWLWGPTITLQDCLAAFFSEDELKGDNMYSCEKCKKLRNGKKYSKVMKLPEILCIHLKRFRHEFMFSTKISSYVSFPLENMDMGPYLHKDCSDQVTTYDLVAVICHHGTAGGGHYTSYGLNYINEQWYEFDDQYVTEVDLQQVEHCEAYVLFYRKKNDRMIPLRQKAEQITEVPENSFMKFYISKQWINIFNTFSEPGPISNYDFVCRHGGVHPYKWPHVDELVTEVPQKLWEFLNNKYGGGPAVTHLYQCTTCQLEMDRLRRRQRNEMDTFLRLQEEFQNDDSPDAVYAISLTWFKEWETFVRAKTDEPPSPIDNSKIAITKAGHTFLRPKSDYGQISERMWYFLHEIYGGGPDIILQQNRPLTSQGSQVSQSSFGSTTTNGGHKAEETGDHVTVTTTSSTSSLASAGSGQNKVEAVKA